MRLYIANTTPQVYEINYRLGFNAPGETKFYPARRQTIPPGRQVVVGDGKLDAHEVEAVVAQLSRYGMHAVEDVKRGRLASKVPLIFNVEQPVPKFAIENVRALNHSILLEEGRQRRARAAVAANDIVADAVAKEFADAGVLKEPTQNVSVEFERAPDESLESETDLRIGEGFRIGEGGATRPAELAGAKTGRNAPWSPERRARFNAKKGGGQSS